ncbi:MAG: M90 family metallopeptidase [Bacteroidota bacterium]
MLVCLKLNQPQDNYMRRLNILAYIIGALIFALYLYGINQFRASDPTRFIFLLLLPIVPSVILLFRMYQKRRKRRQALARPFPENWRKLLEAQVVFYQKLNAKERIRFEKAIQDFLYDTSVTGVGTEVDDITCVLVAASAVIPIFGFPVWRYRNLQEVLIYPGRFNGDNYQQQGEGRDTLGMVGTGAMSGKMILSKPALINGFAKNSDGHNTGIHEFVHLLDGSDGDFDGIPHILDQKYILPWLGLMHREMKRIQQGKSKLRPYGATNKAEFFAVASEFFFERPDELRLHYPKLYELLKKIFQQDLRAQFSPAILRKIQQS